MAECKHGLDTEWCATCKHGPEPKPKEEVVGTFFAKYHAAHNCGGCNLPMQPGQRLAKMSTGRHLHEECV